MDNTLSKIRGLIEAGKIEEAESALSDALQTTPASPELLNLQAELSLKLGTDLWEKGDVDRALDYLARALEINPSDRNIVLTCGEVLTSLEQIESAKNLYSAYLQKKPDEDEIARALRDIEKTAARPSDLTQQDKKAKIRVSAIVSTYNSERFIRECLEDLVNQTLYKKGQLEIIVVDSGSQQNEKKIVEEFQTRYENIVYIRTDVRETVYAAWNRGIKAAKGTYITNANTDDRHRKDALEFMADLLGRKPHVGLVYPDVIITATENETFEKHHEVGAYNWSDYNREFLALGCFMGPQPMWRKSLHERYGYFEESFTVCGDWEFWLRIAEGTELLHIPEYLGLYYFSPASVEQRNADKKYHENLLIQTKYIPKYFPGFDTYFTEVLKNDPTNQNITAWYGKILTSLGKYDKAIALYSAYLKLKPANRVIADNLNEIQQRRAMPMSSTPPEIALKAGKEFDAVQSASAAVSHSIVVAPEPYNEEHPLSSTIRRDFASIIVPVSHQEDITRRCIECIKKNTAYPHEIIFVPARPISSHNWIRKLVKEHLNYKLIEINPPSAARKVRRKDKKSAKEAALSLAKVCNNGIRETSGEYIVLLSDTVQVTDGWLSGLIECLNSSMETGIVGPVTVNIDGRQRYGGSDYDLEHLDDFAKSFRERNRYRRVPVMSVDICCMLFRRGLTEKIGLLDEVFETHEYADDDYCLLAIMEGYTNLIAGDVFVHFSGHAAPDDSTNDSAPPLIKDKKNFSEKWLNLTKLESGSRKGFCANTLLIADELNQKGQKEKAITTLLDAIKSCPDDKRLPFALADIFLENDKFKETLDLLERLPDEMKKDVKALHLFGASMEGVKHLTEAEKYADEILALEPASAQALNLKGTLAFARLFYPDAEKFFRKALEFDRGCGEAYSNLGALQWQQGKKEEAFGLLEKAFILSPTSEDMVTNYYSSAVSLSKLEQAERCFRETIALYPFTRRLQFVLMDNLLQRNRFDDAMQLMEKALITFGIDDDTIYIALKIRERVGAMEIHKEKDSRIQGVKDSSEDSKETPSAPRTLESLDPASSDTRTLESSTPGTLSLCMIVKNEESTIMHALQSVKPMVDEMIIIDTGSTDRTKKIAQVFGAKVYDFPWTNDFSDARNFSLSKASGDWILILDADEVISSADHDKLRKLVETRRDSSRLLETFAFSFVSRNYVGPVCMNWYPNDGKYREEAGSGWFPSTKVRLFPNNPAIRFEYPVHELVENSLNRIGMEIRDSNVPIHHYGKLSKEKSQGKGEEYYQLGKKKLEEEGESDPHALFELGIQAAELEKHDEALRYWKKLIALRPYFPRAYHELGSCYFSLGRYEEALAAFEKASQLDPEAKEPKKMCATCELYMGNADASISHLKVLLKKDPHHPPALLSITAAYFCLGRKDRALEFAHKVKNTQFSLPPLLSDVAKRLMSARQFDYACRLLEGAIETGNTTNETRQLLEECLKERDLIEINRDSVETKVKETHRDSWRLMEAHSPNLNKSQPVSGLRGSQSVSISLCMIVKNEQENIMRALMSVKPVVDEIIVVDTGSTDRTKEMAQDLGAKVFDFAWTDSFADARNFALSKASSGWIFILDADEVISTMDHEKLRELATPYEKDSRVQWSKDSSKIGSEERFRPSRNDKHLNPGTLESLNPAAVAYSLVTRNYVTQANTSGWIANDGTYFLEEEGSGWFPGEKVRLFPNMSAVRFRYPVHERIEPSLLSTGIEIRRCDIPVHHYGKLNREKADAKAEHYYLLLKRKLEESGEKDAMIIYELALQGAELGRHEETLEYLNKVLTIKPDFPNAHQSMGNAYYNLRRYDEALPAYKKALEFTPDSREAVLMYSTCRILTGNAEEAIEMLEKVLRNDFSYPQALVLLAEAYFCTGMKENGLICIKKLENNQPDFGALFANFARMLISTKQFGYAVSLLQAAIETHHTADETKALLEECVKMSKKQESHG